jgi:cytochrome c oxidase cbb3-type subunit 3
MKIKIKTINWALLGLMTMPALLHAAPKGKSATILDWAYNNLVVVIVGIILIGVGLTLWNLMNTMVRYHQKELLREKGVDLKEEVAVQGPSIFKQLYDKAWSLIPIDKEADIDLGHDYDGIRELDNRLPPWWVYTFYLTIGIAVVYLYVYHMSDIGNSQHEEYMIAMEIAEEQKWEYLAAQANAIDEKSVVALMDEKSLADGSVMFKASCAACHGQLGEGGVGPNLTDPYWLHGGSIQDVFKTIKYGVPEKGMIAWKNQMQPAAMQKLASYILTLKGTNPPNQKEPQGELYTPEEDLSVVSQ